jgi:hypothetical protein
MAKAYLRLQPSEVAVLHSASTIYAAYIQNGQVSEENTDEYLQRSLREALRLALTAERAIIAEGEVDSDE